MTGMENITAGICGKSSRDNSGVFRRWEVWVYSVMLILVLVGLVLVLVLACPVLVNITGYITMKATSTKRAGKLSNRCVSAALEPQR